MRTVTAVQDETEATICQKLSEIDGLNIEFGLNNCRHNVATYQRLLKRFLELHNDDVEKIRLALDANNLDLAKEIAHTLKGSAGVLGAEKIQKFAESAEQPLKKLSSGSVDVVRTVLGPLSEAIMSLRKQLEFL